MKSLHLSPRSLRPSKRETYERVPPQDWNCWAPFGKHSWRSWAAEQFLSVCKVSHWGGGDSLALFYRYTYFPLTQFQQSTLRHTHTYARAHTTSTHFVSRKSCQKKGPKGEVASKSQQPQAIHKRQFWMCLVENCRYLHLGRRSWACTGLNRKAQNTNYKNKHHARDSVSCLRLALWRKKTPKSEKGFKDFDNFRLEIDRRQQLGKFRLQEQNSAIEFLKKAVSFINRFPVFSP